MVMRLLPIHGSMRWFPYLTKYQIENSLRRSKFILEQVTGSGKVTGFVPPHDRPYSWFSKFAWSLGDRALYPFHPGSSIGNIADELVKQNYKWYRVTYRSLWNKLLDWKGENYMRRMESKWVNHNGLICFQGTYNGFDDRAQELLKKAIEKNSTLVIVGHPAALLINGAGNKDHYEKFMELALSYKASNQLSCHTVQNYIDKFILQ